MILIIPLINCCSNRLITPKDNKTKQQTIKKILLATLNINSHLSKAKLPLALILKKGIYRVKKKGSAILKMLPTTSSLKYQKSLHPNRKVRVQAFNWLKSLLIL